MAGCRLCSALLDEGATHCTSCGSPITLSKKTDPLLGKTLLNQYIVIRKIGQGGFGTVYEAKQPSMGRHVAIKTLHPHLTGHSEIVSRFRREGLAASQLQHPSAVKMHNLGETEDGVLWIAMEFLEGETLQAKILREGALSARVTVEILAPVCALLYEAHQKGIIHRDLKPENIMLCPFPGKTFLPKVLDFGIAGILGNTDGATKSGMVSGTPQYMSPEQWKGLKYVDARSDLYSLGVIGYQCLSGKLPFEADTAPAWMTKHCLEEPLALSETIHGKALPVSLVQTIMRALSKEPESRFPNALTFQQNLESSLSLNGKEENSLHPLVQTENPALTPTGPTLPIAENQEKLSKEEPLLKEPESQVPKKRGLFLNFSLGKFKIAFGIALAFLLVIFVGNFWQPPKKDRSNFQNAQEVASIEPEKPASLPIVIAALDDLKKDSPVAVPLELEGTFSINSSETPGKNKPLSPKEDSPTGTNLSLAKKEEKLQNPLATGSIASLASDNVVPRKKIARKRLPFFLVRVFGKCIGMKTLKEPSSHGTYTLRVLVSAKGDIETVSLKGPISPKNFSTCTLSEIDKVPPAFIKEEIPLEVTFEFTHPFHRANR